MLPRRSRPAAPRRRMYVAFVLGGEARVLPAEAVAAVDELGPVTPLPTADPSLLGITLHQGKAVVLLSPPATDSGPASVPGHLLVLRAGGGGLGLAVEELTGLKVEYGDDLPAGFSLLEGLPPAGGPP